MLLCSKLFSSTRLFQHVERSPICKDQPLTKNERWWGVEIKRKKNAGRQDIMTPAAWGGRRREGQPLSKYSSLQQTGWKQRPRPLGKDRKVSAGRRVWGWQVFGSIEKSSLCTDVWAPAQCLFLQGLHAVTARGCSGGCIASSASSGSGRLLSVNKLQAGMWHLKFSVGRKMRDLYFQLYGNAHSSFDI